jgi:hypothetical protein
MMLASIAEREQYRRFDGKVTNNLRDFTFLYGHFCFSLRLFCVKTVLMASQQSKFGRRENQQRRFSV